MSLWTGSRLILFSSWWVSPTAQTRHLKTLARISRLVQHTKFVDSIKCATTAEEILKTLAEEDGKHKG